uniref:Late expression factor 12 n=1 Tax=Helicoverpa armigera nucleopolyhedrovirus TaxID=51313 RepID=A0A0E3JAK8_9ABAC|nr:late expression factor 12 [Helicoverpa armigera nucleopolyhedrovirus]
MSKPSTTINSASTITVLDNEEYSTRLKSIKTIVDIAKEAIEDMVKYNELERDDADSLSVADATAAWVCGRVANNNYVTMRIQCSKANFDGHSRALDRLHFDQSYEQLLLSNSEWQYFIYTKYTIPMLNLIVVKRTDVSLLLSNPCLQLAYLINVRTGQIETRDCDCLRVPNNRHGYVEMKFDEDYVCDERDQHCRSLLLQEDLIEQPYDHGIVKVECEHITLL